MRAFNAVDRRERLEGFDLERHTHGSCVEGTWIEVRRASSASRGWVVVDRHGCEERRLADAGIVAGPGGAEVSVFPSRSSAVAAVASVLGRAPRTVERGLSYQVVGAPYRLERWCTGEPWRITLDLWAGGDVVRARGPFAGLRTAHRLAREHREVEARWRRLRAGQPVWRTRAEALRAIAAEHEPDADRDVGPRRAWARSR